MKCQHCGGSGEKLDVKALGRRLRKARLAKGLGLREAARRAKCSATYAVMLENGKGFFGPKAQKYLEMFAGVAHGETK